MELAFTRAERLAKKLTSVTVQSGALASRQWADAQWTGWKVWFSRQMVVPTLYRSQQGLWIILSNWVMISGKRPCGGVFRTFFILSYYLEKPRVEHHPVQLYSREYRCLSTVDIAKTCTESIELDKQHHSFNSSKQAVSSFFEALCVVNSQQKIKNSSFKGKCVHSTKQDFAILRKKNS